MAKKKLTATRKVTLYHNGTETQAEVTDKITDKILSIRTPEGGTIVECKHESLANEGEPFWNDPKKKK